MRNWGRLINLLYFCLPVDVNVIKNIQFYAINLSTIATAKFTKDIGRQKENLNDTSVQGNEKFLLSFETPSKSYQNQFLFFP